MSELYSSITISPLLPSLNPNIRPVDLSENYYSPSSDSPKEETEILELPVKEVLALLS